MIKPVDPLLYYHREYTDPSLAPYANQYFLWMRHLYNSGVRFHSKFVTGPGHYGRIQLAGKHMHVMLLPQGEIYFEFGTSGRPVVNLSLTTEGTTFSNAYKVAIVGVNVSDTGTIKAVIRGNKRKLPMEAASIVQRQSQINLDDEPVGYRSYDTSNPETPKQTTWPSTIYESWAPNHPYTGVYLRAWNFGGNGVGVTTNRGSWEAHTLRDVLFDVPYQDTEDTNPVRIGLLRGDTDWPRAMGRMLVKAPDAHPEWGDREFAVYEDGFNQVSVFPLAAMPEPGPLTSLDQNIPEPVVKRQVIPLPSWVFKGTQRLGTWWEDNHTTGLVEFPELDWKFHPDGKRAVAVVHERQAANYDSAYFTSNVGTNPLTSDDFDEHRDNNTGYATRHNGTFQHTNLPQRYCIGTGIIEFVVAIEINGPNLADYDLTVTINEIRRPTTALYCTMLAGYVWYDIKAVDWTAEIPKFDAKRGDMVCLDIERYYRGSDGNVFNFYSTKNLSKAGGTEIRTWQGYQLLDFDMATLSLALLVPGVSSYNRTLIRPEFPPHAAGSASLEYTVVHPSVAISTFNRPRKILFPDSILPEMKDAITEHWQEDMRAKLNALDGDWTFMPLNDARSWADTDLANLRDYYCQEILQHKSGLSPTLPPLELRNWFNIAMFAYLPPTPLYYIDAPRFGWHVYADEIMNRMWVNPSSTFFTHPNGSWAFYNNQIIYNKHGFWGPTGDLDSLTPFQEDDEALEHCIFDYVHFETGKATAESSFHDLYNKAVQAGIDAGVEPDTPPFQTVTKAQLRANFDKSHTITVGHYTYLDLNVLWYPHGIFYYPEQVYQKSDAYTLSFMPGGGGIRDLTMGGMFNEFPNYGGLFQSGYAFNTPIQFSSCLMIA